MKLLADYKNGNYRVEIFDDGTKIRETINELDNKFVPDFPESFDLKITDKCTGTMCAFCHENSCPTGLHGDILNAEFINTLRPYTELACLSGSTIVYGDEGLKYMKDLKIGDMIFDNDNILRKITNIKTSNKSSLILKGSKGFNSVCSNDHPFMVNGNKINSKDLLNKLVDRLNPISAEENVDYVVDMGNHINEKSDLVGSRGGKIYPENEIRLTNSSPHTPRYIKITNDIMWLYGLFVAEGSVKGIVLNINEKEYANRVEKVWFNTFGLGVRKIINEKSNSLSIEFITTSIVDKLFYKEFKIGKGSRNVSLSYLFGINNKELIKNALIGLFDGDGCYRERKSGNSVSRIVSLKTTSKKLVYEVSYLLAKWFGIYSSIDYGISKKRKIEENRYLEESDYYNLSIYGIKDINKLFSEQYDNVLSENWVNNEKYKGIKIDSIEENTKEEVLYDITLEKGSHIFPINGYALTHNCGGGNPLEHPDLISFLTILKSKNIIANLTVNQKHFVENFDLLKQLTDDKFIYGLGVSLTNPTDQVVGYIQSIDNVVVHVINGIVTESTLEKLYDKGLKVLILGYKIFRRGEDFYSEEVESRKSMLYNLLPKLTKKFKVVSFDNLAIKQLDVKRLLSEEKWNEFYMGDDGQYTMYIDMVKKQFARSSTSVKRYGIMNDIVDMFNVVRSE